MRKCTFTVFTKVEGADRAGSVPMSGQFHAWTRDVSAAGKVVPKAIVEDDDGSVYLVPPHVVKFDIGAASQPGYSHYELELLSIAKRIEGRISAATLGFDGFLRQMHETFRSTCQFFNRR